MRGRTEPIAKQNDGRDTGRSAGNETAAAGRDARFVDTAHDFLGDNTLPGRRAGHGAIAATPTLPAAGGGDRRRGRTGAASAGKREYRK